MTRSASLSRPAIIAAAGLWIVFIVAQAAIGDAATFWALVGKSVLATAATVALAFAGVGGWVARAERKRWTKRMLPVIGERVAEAHDALAKLVMTAIAVAAPLIRLDRLWYDSLVMRMDLPLRKRDPPDPWAEIDRAVKVLTDALRDQEEQTRAVLNEALMTGNTPQVARGGSASVSRADQRLIVARAAEAGPLLSTLIDRLRSALTDLAQAAPDDDLAARLLEDAAATQSTIGSMIEAATRPPRIRDREDLRELLEERDLGDRARAILGDPSRGLRGLLTGAGRSAQDILADLSEMYGYTGGARAVPAIAGFLNLTVAHYAASPLSDSEPTQST
jgi:hypothetical protein